MLSVAPAYKTEPPVIRERVPTMDFELEDDDIVEAALVTPKKASSPPPAPPARRISTPAPISAVRPITQEVAPVIPQAAPIPSELVALAAAPAASEFMALAAPSAPPPLGPNPFASSVPPAPFASAPPPPPPSIAPPPAPVATTSSRPPQMAQMPVAVVRPIAVASAAALTPPPAPAPAPVPAPAQSGPRVTMSDPMDLLFDQMYELNYATSTWEAASVCASTLAKALGARSVVIHAHDLARRELRAIGAHGAGDVDILGLSEASDDDLVASAVICNQKSVTMNFGGELPRVAPKRLHAVGAPRTLVAVPAMAWGRCLAIIEIIDADEKYAARVADSASYVAERFAEFLSANAA